MQCNFTGTLLINMMPPVLFLQFVFGVLGNGLALWIFIFHMRPWKSSTVLLFNLALADFLLNMALPFRASYYYSGIEWRFGNALCLITLFMLALNRSGSTFFLMVIALDRYIRVVHPHHPINSLSLFKAACGAAVLWLLTVSMTLHVLMIQRAHPTICESFTVETAGSLNLSWHKFAFLFSFFLPLLVILFCTIRIVGHLKGRQLGQQAKIKKALCFITIVAVIFIVCFLPSNITEIVIWVQTSQLISSEVCAAVDFPTTVFYITISLTYLNSMLDPVLYYFSSSTFKNICRKAVNLKQVNTIESNERKIRETASQTQSISQL
ncbi:hydroxycarboxylic acid receptor 3-like [Genypterus blacodes]|uniref:hydroxycarboxylic acid receptor 3-like n=1 Tax=Genypterus blacodes TaxID=154954 RepID=UPI003F768402